MDVSAADRSQLVAAPRPRRLITGLGITQILAWGTSFYLPAVLAPPIVADTGWPLAWVVGSFSVALLMSGLAAPRTGRLIHRFGGRPVLAGGFVLLALGLGLLGLSPNFPAFVFAWLVIGIGMSASLYEAAFSSLGRIYGASARRAITTLTLFGGFASTVCWPLSAFFVETIGWRGACFAYAATHLVLCVPLILTVLPREAARPAIEAESHDGSTEPTALQRSAQRRAFALLTLILITGGLTFSLFSVHVVTLLQSSGASLAIAVSLAALIGPAQVGGRVIEMAVGYRFHPLWTLISATFLIAAGIALMASGFALPAAALVLYGAGNGIWSIAKGTVPLALFGPLQYPIIMGRLVMPALAVQAAAPVAGAMVIERFGTSSALLLLSFLSALNLLFACVLSVIGRGVGRL